MASSLASQLSGIRSLSAARLASTASLSSHASYLFPPQTAARQDLDTVFALGETGWLELCNEDLAFEKWKEAQSLFGAESKGKDRTMMTKEENRQLDLAIETFFDLSGPILLGKSAAKCLEWLVRRFRIQDFNYIVTLRAFMPYHQTPQFARMLHILKIESEPYLKFLLPFKKAVRPLPSSVLLSALSAPATSNPSLDLLHLVLNTLQPGKKSTRAQVSFWSSILVQLCSRQGGRGASSQGGLAKSSKSSRGATSQTAQQDGAQLVLSAILPAAIAVIADRTSSLESRLAGCLVLCSIGANFELNGEAVDSTVAAVFPAIAHLRADPQLVQAVLTSSAALHNSKPGAQKQSMSASTVSYASKVPGLSEHILRLNKRFNVEGFVSALLRGLASESDDRESHVILGRLLSADSNEGGIHQDLAVDVLTQLLASHGISPTIAYVLAQVKSNREDIFDAFVKAQVQAGGGGVPASRILSAATRSNFDAEMLLDDQADEFSWLDLNSAAPGQRLAALTALLRSIAAGHVEASDKPVTEALTARLLEDDVEVLDLLYAPDNAQVLLGALSSETILRQAEAVLAPTAVISAAVLQRHTNFLLGPFLLANPKSSTRVFRNVLWPRLIVTQQNHNLAQATRQCIRSLAPQSDATGPLSHFWSLLRGVINLQDHNDASTNEAVADNIAQTMASMDSDSHFNAHLAHTLQQSTSGTFTSTVLALLVLTRLLPSLTKTERRDSIGHNVLEVYSRALLSTQGLTQSSKDILPQIYEGASPRVIGALQGEVVIAVAQSLRCGTTKEMGAVLGLAAETPTSSLPLALKIYRLAAQSMGKQTSELHRRLLPVLFARLHEHVPSFLCGVATGESDTVTQLAALKHLQAYLSAYQRRDTRTCTDFQVLIPALLVAASNSDAEVRREALLAVDLIGKLASSTVPAVGSGEIWGYDQIYGSRSHAVVYLETATTARFASTIADNSESIINDRDFLTALLGDVLSFAKGQSKADATYRVSVVSYLASHVVSWPSFKCKISLLAAMSKVRDGTKLAALLPLIDIVIRPAEDVVTTNALNTLPAYRREEFVSLLFGLFDKRSKVTVEDESSNAWGLLLSAIRSPDSIISSHASGALQPVWTFLTPEQRKQAVETLADRLVDPQIVAPAAVRKSFISLAYDANLLVSILADLRLELTEVGLGSPVAKKSRNDQSKKDLVTRSAAILSEILEVALQSRVGASAGLLAELFEILRLAVEMHSSRTLNADYILHLAMSNLNRLLQSATPTSSVIQSLRVDTVVNVIKASKNPATFQQALLVLSSIATLAPETVLHSAMPVFTFVGSSVLQRDDAFSFTVVERVLRSVVPPLVISIRQKCNLGPTESPTAAQHFELVRLARPYLCIFTDSANHIPRHRRQAFFQLLAEVLGPQDYAAPVALLLVDRTAHKIARQERSAVIAAAASETISQSLHLPLAVLSSHAAQLQMKALTDIWEEIQRLWATRALAPTDTEQHVFLDRLSRMGREHADHQIDAITQIIASLSLVKFVVASPQFRVKSRRAIEDGSETARADLQQRFGYFVESALLAASYEDEAIVSISRAALASIMALVPIDSFMAIVNKLIGEKDEAMCINAFQLVSERFTEMSLKEREQASASTGPVILAACSCLESTSTRSTALAALQAMTRRCATSEHSAFSGTVPSLLNVVRSHDTTTSEKRLSLAVITSLTGVLGPRLLAHLQQLITVSVSAAREAVSDSLCSIALETLERLFRSVPEFLESQLETVVALLVSINVREQGLGSKAMSAHQALRSTLVKKMSSGKVLSAIVALWDSFGNQAAEQVSTLKILQGFLRQVDRSGLATLYKAVFRFILRVLDQRRINTVMAVQDVDEVEDAGVQTFVRLVLKLSESTFRPLFLRVFDWAALDLAEDDMEVSDAGLVSRRIALFKVNNALHDQLRNLVSHYYSTMLDLSIELLDAFRLGKLSDARLWFQVVASVEKSARWDEGTFWNPARLQKLAPVFIGQLSSRNTRLVAALEGASVVRAALTPATVQLARCVSDEGSLKVLNSSLLTALRIDEASTRVSALHILTAIWSEPSLNSVLLGLVPETVPHIAELMESDDTEAVSATKSFISAVEGVLGESLDSYLQ